MTIQARYRLKVRSSQAQGGRNELGATLRARSDPEKWLEHSERRQHRERHKRFVSTIQQVRVVLDDQWRVGITLPDGTTLPTRELRRALHPDKLTARDERETPLVLPWPPETDPTPEAIRVMATRCQRLVRREPRADAATDDFDIRAVGRHLFDVLFGADAWSKILAGTSQAKVIELALEWSKNERDLHRFNWEMLHGPAGFLAAGYNNQEGRLVRVAISRVVSEARCPNRPPSPLPRILFVVGSSLNDPRIRAGAEFFGLLRKLEAKQYGSTFVTRRNLPLRLLLEANAERLAQTLREFQPDIVHLIAHGAMTSGSVVLKFRPDSGQQGEQLVKAGDLLELLTIHAPGEAIDGFRPSVVILAACFSGAAPTAVTPGDALTTAAAAATTGAPTAGAEAGGGEVSAPRTRLDGPWRGGPLAAELVAGGIPMVIGMAGEVADQACRLFTRTFGEALVTGTPLLLAAECGRRAAYTLGGSPERSVDWALPTLYRAADASPTFTVIASKPTDEETRVADALGQLRMERDGEPVMAARFELLAENYRKLREGDKGTLALLGVSGSGKSRVLRELAVQAARDGHLPLFISTEPEDSEAFATAEAVASTWAQSVENLADAFGIDRPDPFHLRQPLAVPPGTNPMRPLLQALREDLVALIAQARSRFPKDHLPGTTAWVLLDHLELYGQELQPGLFFSDLVLSKWGLGRGQQSIIPVVAAVNLDAPSAQGLKLLAEKKRPDWMDWQALDRFPTAADEHLLTYGHVLLQPHTDKFKDTNNRSISGLSLIFNPSPPDAMRGASRLKKLRKYCDFLPQDFDSERFYTWVEEARDDKVLIEATDEDLLKQLIR